jgi:adenylate cyclase
MERSFKVDRLSSPTLFFVIAAGLIGGANLIGVAASQGIATFIYTEAEAAWIDQARQFSIVLPIAFTVPLVINFLYALPVLRALGRVRRKLRSAAGSAGRPDATGRESAGSAGRAAAGAGASASAAEAAASSAGSADRSAAGRAAAGQGAPASAVEHSAAAVGPGAAGQPRASAGPTGAEPAGVWSSTVGEPAKKRLLRFPLVASLVGVTGWLVGQAPLLTSPEWTTSEQLETAGPVYITLSVLVAFLVFVIAFFALELVYRRFYYHRVFEDDAIPSNPSRFRFGLGTRMTFYFLALIGFPLGILLLAVLRIDRASPGGTEILPVLLFGSAAFVVGLVLTGLFVRAVQRPLARMAATARRVGRGDYSASAPVLANDEIGELGHAMNEMVSGLSERERLRDAFGRAVTPEVRDLLVERGATLGGTELTVTVLFLDIRGFTTLSEQLSPEETLSWLNTVFGAVGRAVAAEGGTIDKFIGDAVMGVFGAPVPQEDHADRALRAVRAIERDVASLSISPKLSYGVGVHSGAVLAGTVGMESRMDFTVIGDAVNTASRVEALCKELGQRVLLTGEFVDALTARAPADATRAGAGRQADSAAADAGSQADAAAADNTAQAGALGADAGAQADAGSQAGAAAADDRVRARALGADAGGRAGASAAGLRDLGEHPLRGRSKPVRLYTVA